MAARPRVGSKADYIHHIGPTISPAITYAHANNYTNAYAYAHVCYAVGRLSVGVRNTHTRTHDYAPDYYVVGRLSVGVRNNKCHTYDRSYAPSDSDNDAHTHDYTYTLEDYAVNVDTNVKNDTDTPTHSNPDVIPRILVRDVELETGYLIIDGQELPTGVCRPGPWTV